MYGKHFSWHTCVCGELSVSSRGRGTCVGLAHTCGLRVAHGPCGGLPGAPAVGVGTLQPPHWLVGHGSSSQRLVPVTAGRIPVDGRGGLASESLPRAVPNV